MDEQASRALSKSNAHFASPRGTDLFDRLGAYCEWINDRHQQGFFPYARSLASAPSPEAHIAYLGGQPSYGINLAVQDYLGLASHDAVRESAIKAVRDFGVHSAGSAMLLGNNPLSASLEQDLSEFLNSENILLFPTGWGAGFGVVKGLIREHDHIVIDNLAHACLQEGSSAATKNISRYTHLDIDDAKSKISAIRARDKNNAVLVIAEGLYSMDSDVPDLLKLQEICHEFGARLLVDVAHDLGALGPNGTGSLGAAGLLSRVDIIVGAFSKTFASNGGFVACQDAKVKMYLRWFANPHTFSNALSPIQCAVVSTAIRIVRSEEGQKLRNELQRLSTFFRGKLQELGCLVLGSPSAIVPVLIGREGIARRASKKVNESGTFTNLVEFPAVGLRQARFRCQLMATHTVDQLSKAAVDIAEAINSANHLTDNSLESLAFSIDT